VAYFRPLPRSMCGKTPKVCLHAGAVASTF
jgi:hypothetical protein